MMQVQAPKGQYRVIGLDPVDTLSWPSGPLWKDCDSLDEARDFADQNEALYTWIDVYDDNGEVLYETGCYQQQLEMIKKLDQEPPGGSKPEL